MSFLNKVALVTGAGSGIGQSVALHLSKLHARLALIDINLEGLKKTAEACEKATKTKVYIQAADLSKDEDVARSIENAEKEYGRIDIVVNCVGIFSTGNLLDDDVMEVYDRVISINLRSIIAVTKAVAPALVKTQGNIINISSISGVLVTLNTLIYNISKAALTHFTKGTAVELAPEGVRVNAILPGPVRTNFLVNSNILKNTESDAFWDATGKTTPLGHCVRAEEVAELISFLVSDKAKSITGACQLIDSGVLLVGSQAAPEKLKTLTKN